MATERPSLLPVVGPDGLARDAPVITYTEKIIEEEQLQLKRYINENYSKIRDVERELENLTLEMKLTAGPKKAALEHLRKKIELSTEKIHAAKLKEEQAQKAWEAAAKFVKDEEAAKQKLCDDLNQLVQESAASQFARLEELKKRLEALNPNRTSSDVPEVKPVQGNSTPSMASSPAATSTQGSGQRLPEETQNLASGGGEVAGKGTTQQPSVDAEGKGRKRVPTSGRGKGNMMILPKSKGSSGPGWTGAGFDVDGRA